ncbi:hypothetical protein [Corynebacterium glaucum]|uniref:hypothetical protein n=1 Tax=Corynebacterium glaucum TaxID=187491 RepID=UPI001E49C191|nr:hypothetical protein [Corynebacterium glaucum]
MPGPLFTFASFLGASAQGVHWLWGAALATVAIFLPAALLVRRHAVEFKFNV